MKTQLRFFGFGLYICALLVLNGCTISRLFAAQGQQTTAAIDVSEPAPTITATVDADPTTPAPPADPEKCAAPNASLPFPGASYGGLPEVILEFLNQGGTLQQLDQGLYDLGYLGQPQGIAAGDLDGNAQLDLAVVVINPSSSAVTPEGKLLFYLCQEGTYRLFGAASPAEMEAATPIIKFVQDMNQDGAEEVVAGFANCGAHTCYESFAIYGWQDTAMVNLLPDSREPVDSPQASLEGPDAQGFTALKIVSGGIGSVGAGPQRSRTIVYTYDSKQGAWTFFGSQAGQSEYRLHTLHDADDLAVEEKFSEALVLYQQVISSTALRDWQAPEIERTYLSSYAHLKMAEIYTLLDRPELAQASETEFEQFVLPDSASEGYLEVLRVFQRSWNGENLAETCSAVQEYVASRSAELVDPLGPQQFGYANRAFEPRDFCPWQ